MENVTIVHIVIYLKFGAENLIQYFNSSLCSVGDTENRLQSEFRNVTSTNQFPTLRPVTLNLCDLYVYVTDMTYCNVKRGGHMSGMQCTWILLIIFWQEILSE